MSPRARTPQERREAVEERRARRAESTDPDVVMEAAASFLAVRPRSAEETRRRLVHLGYPPGLCDEVIARLVEMRYLDDLDFARAWVESRDRAKPRGAAALRRELQLKGVPADTIVEVLATRAEQVVDRSQPGDAMPADAERDAARKLLERRASTFRRETDLRRRRQKAYALLARNGFTPDVCSEVAAALVDHETEQAV